MTREEKNKEMQDEFDYEETKEKRKEKTKKIIKISSIIIILLSLLFIHTKFIATSGIKVKEKRLTFSNIPDSFNGVKIIQFSDLQYGSNIYIENVDKLVKKINLRNPDIIIFTGDLIDETYKIKNDEIEKIIKSLKKLNANIGKYAVNGDEDNENFTTILTQAGFNVLDNNYDLIYNQKNEPILITGLSSSKTRNINKSFEYFKSDNVNKDIFTISIMHEADDIDKIIKDYKVDIAFAGGNLNGQIYIPKVGGLFTRKNATKYTKPYYKLNNTRLYISSGIGTDNIGLRLFNKPSINFIRLAKSR